MSAEEVGNLIGALLRGSWHRHEGPGPGATQQDPKKTTQRSVQAHKQGGNGSGALCIYHPPTHMHTHTHTQRERNYLIMLHSRWR